MAPVTSWRGGAADRRTRVWDVPTAVWAYGFLRAVAAAVPVATGTGGIGVGALIVLVLYVLVIRASRLAWSALLVLDVLSLALLLATQQDTGAPWLLHIFTGASIIALLWASTRAWVAGTPAARRSD